MLVFRVFFLRNRLMELSEFVLNWHIRIWFIIHSASVTQSDVLGWQTRYFFAQTRAEGGVSVRAYGKSWDYNVYDCRYCLYWKGRKKAASILAAAAVRRSKSQQNKVTRLSSAMTKIRRILHLFRSAGIVPTGVILPVSGGVRRRSCAPWDC